VRGWLYTLLLLNIAFFGWAHWIDAPAAAPAPPRVARTLPTLALVGAPPTAAVADRSAGSAQGPAARPPPAGPKTPAGERCRSLGPFADAANATRVAGLLHARALAPSERDVDVSVSDGYTVFIEQPGDAAAMHRALARLSGAGISDARAASGPDGHSRITFGVFPDQPHAVRRAEQARALGFKPVLDLHQSTVTTHWLDLQLQPNQPEPPVERLLAGEGADGHGVDVHGAGGTAIAFSDCPA
jgi:hypothetical protein